VPEFPLMGDRHPGSVAPLGEVLLGYRSRVEPAKFDSGSVPLEEGAGVDVENRLILGAVFLCLTQPL